MKAGPPGYDDRISETCDAMSFMLIAAVCAASSKSIACFIPADEEERGRSRVDESFAAVELDGGEAL